MEIKTKHIRRIFGLVVAAIAVNWGLNNPKQFWSFWRYVQGLFMPLLLGLGIAFVLSVPTRTIENEILVKLPFTKKLGNTAKRHISLWSALLLLALFVAFVLVLVVPQLIDAVSELGQKMPGFVSQVQQWSDKLVARYPALTSYEPDWKDLGGKAASFLEQRAGGFLNSMVGTVSGMFGSIFNFFMGFIFAINAVIHKERLAVQCNKALYAIAPSNIAGRAAKIFRMANEIFSGFVAGQCTEAIISGTLCFIGMSLLKIPYAMMVSVMVCLGALVPIVGPLVVTIVGAFVVFVSSPIKAVMFIVFYQVLQQVEGNLIYPRVVGKSVGLPSMWVALAVLIGGNIMGMFGMLISVPLCSLLYSLFRNWVNERVERLGMEFKVNKKM